MDIDYIKELGKYTQFYNYSNCNMLKSLLRSAKKKNEFVYGYFVDSYNIKYLYEFVKEGKLNDNALKFGTLIDVDTYSPYFMGSNSEWYNVFLRTDENGKLWGFTDDKSVNNKSDDNTGGKSMSKASETMQTVISMKMLNGLMKNGEQDLGKLMIMQQMMGGEKIQVTDVIKAKLINEFSLDKSGDLPLEKVMLMQMLDGGEVDTSQILAMKMLGSVLDETGDKTEAKQ